ncbi:hypothetical protein W5A_06885 [Imtechella halotolerans K1]|uniref:Uncharacterized protein n=1 Tax=Imtechella halotolerans K1 TaxID=946077 RepID=I0WFV9_9FLAO|nr:hypothetical protein W5A_06885 [Imtechella halotolerans K1]
MNLQQRNNKNSYQEIWKEKLLKFKKVETKGNKKWQATYIAPLQPHTFAAFPPWRILQELVV